MSSLRDLARREGLFVGAAIEPSIASRDPNYAMTLAREFNSLTPENVMKWRVIHPEPDRWVFAPADALMHLAEAGGQRVRGHTLVWGRSALPDYLRTLAADDLRAAVAEHIRTVVGRYAGRIAQWDVVNEPLTSLGGDGTSDGLDPSLFWQRLGPGYIRDALVAAHAADPGAKLFINEFRVETPGQKQERLFRLVKELIAEGAPLHGVGLQAHLGVRPRREAPIPTIEQLRTVIERFSALGLIVELTELDVTIHTFSGSAADRLEQQGRAYEEIFAACRMARGCGGITTWGIGDRHTWLRTVLDLTDEAPLLFDDAYRRKPAYEGAVRGLRLLSEATPRDR